jgi:hypothetical protein
MPHRAQVCFLLTIVARANSLPVSAKFLANGIFNDS